MILFSYQWEVFTIFKVEIRLIGLLDSRDMSQHELSRLTGIRQPTINEMCRNQVKHIPLDNLAKICEALDCKITDILELVPGE